jgi:hypothetical protein
LHPELYRLHVAELNVDGYLNDDPEAHRAMDELNAATQEALTKRKKEIERLTKLVFEANPNLKSYSLLKFWKKSQEGFGGATDYEVWLRSLDHIQLDHMTKLHTGAIDALRYRRRYILNELERRGLHSSYGKHPAEFLFELENKP